MKFEIKYSVRPTVTCKDCGFSCVGDSSSGISEVFDSADAATRFINSIATMKGSCHSMPVGWASYGTAGLQCPACNK